MRNELVALNTPKTGTSSPRAPTGSPLDGSGPPVEPRDGQHLLVERALRD